jgi:glucan biosynthesis protein
MADATLAQMRNRVLEKLFVLEAGGVANAADTATVEKVIVSTNEELRENEICYWSDDATPQSLVEHLAAYYGCYLANDYMPANEALAFIQTHERRAMDRLRELTATRKRVVEPTRATYF